jgi:cyanosortase A-associated protein
MQPWTLMRLSTLITACCASTAVLVSIIIAPQSDYGEFQAFEFSETTPLNDWQLINSTDSLSDPVDNENSEDRVTYTLEKGSDRLEINLVYLPSSDGDIAKLLDENTNVLDGDMLPLTIEEMGNNGQNSYAVIQDTANERLYLAACVTANGYVTATPEQFEETRQFGKFSFPQQVEWFLGQRRIEDYSCILTLFSMPTDSATIADVEAELESVWWEWHESQQHFVQIN